MNARMNALDGVYLRPQVKGEFSSALKPIPNKIKNAIKNRKITQSIAQTILKTLNKTDMTHKHLLVISKNNKENAKLKRRSKLKIQNILYIEA